VEPDDELGTDSVPSDQDPDSAEEVELPEVAEIEEDDPDVQDEPIVIDKED
jgi:hypothetical protein